MRREEERGGGGGGGMVDKGCPMSVGSCRMIFWTVLVTQQ